MARFPQTGGSGGGVSQIESTDSTVHVTNPNGPVVNLTNAGTGAISSVSAANSTVVVTPTTGAVTVSRGALTGDVTAAANSTATTVGALNGAPLGTMTGAGTGQSVIWSGTAFVPTTITVALVSGALAAANNLSDVADDGTSKFNLELPVLSSVAACAAAPVSLSAPGAAIDGYTLQTNDEVLLIGQATASQNGVWLWNGAASALTRPHEYPSGGVVKRGRHCHVANGTVYANALMVLPSTAAGITIDTTAQPWVAMGLVGTTQNIQLIENIPAQNFTPTASWSMNGQTLTDFAYIGWVQDGTTWTRTANTVFTVPGNVTGTYQTGTVVKWTESAVQKYGIVASSAFTTLTTVTLISTTDYVMAATPDANSNFYAQSWLGLPYDFPSAFTWSSGTTTGGTGPGLAAVFSIRPGRRIRLDFSASINTSTANTFTVTGLPLPSAGNTQSYAALSAFDNSAVISGAVATIGASTSTLTFNKLTALGLNPSGWATTGAKGAVANIEYGY